MKLHHKSIRSLIARYASQPTTGAEIGVYLGQTTGIIHSHWPKCRMLLVDPWQAVVDGDSYYSGGGKMAWQSQAEWDDIYNQAMMNIAMSNGPSLVWRMTSAEAAAHVPDKSLDFVFIDADHTYEGTLRDIALWLPKCRKLLMGHDYNSIKESRYKVWGVKQAVDASLGEEHVFRRRGYVWARRMPTRGRNRQRLIDRTNSLISQINQK